MYDNRAVEQHRASTSNTYDDPHAVGRLRLMQQTRAGEYDNPGEIMRTAEQRVYDNPNGVLEEQRNVYENPDDVYDDGVSRRSRNVYDNQEAISNHQ